MKELPNALKRQVVKCVIIGLALCLISIITWIISKEFLFSLPCLSAGILFILNAVSIYLEGLMEKYVVLCGECETIEQTRLLKRTKSVYLQTDYGLVKIPIRRNIRGLQIGVKVRCYLAVNAGVYEYNGIKVVCDYYLLEVI